MLSPLAEDLLAAIGGVAGRQDSQVNWIQEITPKDTSRKLESFIKEI
jgi:hypothetical protein